MVGKTESGRVPGTVTGRTVLVTGVTGTVGSEVLRAVLERREAGDAVTVRALVREPSRLRAGLSHEVDVVQGDLRDPAALTRALEGVHAAFYVSPHERDEEELARSFVDACERSRARLVYVGVHVDGPNRFVRMLKRAAFGLLFRHYRPKFRISERVRQSRAAPVVLMPSNFFQNDEMVCDLIVDRGSYPLPLGRVNRVDVRDLGDVAARALLDPALAAGAYPVLGPVSLSGAESAATWSNVLGHPVRYEGDDDERFVETMRQRLQGKKLEDILASYRLLRRVDLPTAPRDVAVTTSLLGRPPRSYEAYVRDQTTREVRSARSRAEATHDAS